jgi:hypothetical protein
MSVAICTFDLVFVHYAFDYISRRHAFQGENPVKSRGTTIAKAKAT